MTYAVFFDVLPKKGFADAYFGMAGGLKPIVEKSPGFISVERFENLGQAGWFLSYSQWLDEKALGAWRCQQDHHEAQVCGRNLVLEDYRLRVGSILSGKGGESTKPCMVALVGEFEKVQVAAESAQYLFSKTAILFKGVINPARGVALFESDVASALKLKDSMANQELIELGVYEVQRDYGMFNRVQAPSIFS
jgi:heme-degrading monooxygenase HmoA